MWRRARLIPVLLLAFACLAMIVPETVLARGGGGGRGDGGRGGGGVLAEKADLAKAEGLV